MRDHRRRPPPSIAPAGLDAGLRALLDGRSPARRAATDVSPRPPESSVRRRGRPRCCGASPACGRCSTIRVAGRRPSSNLVDGLEAPDWSSSRPARRRPRGWPGADLEAVNAALVRLKDARLGRAPRPAARRAERSASSPGRTPARPPSPVYTSVQQALSALDRLEVRGRDSAGLHLLVRGHGLDLDSPALRAARGRARRRPAVRLGARCAPPTATSASSTRPRPRSASWATTPARCGPPSPATRCCARRSTPTTAEAVVLGHTRWASVGHHLPAQRPPAQLRGARRRRAARTSPRCSTATSTTSPTSRPPRRCASPAEITTDAKVIPTLDVARPGRRAPTPVEAFRAHRRRARGLGGHRAPAPPPRPATCSSPCAAAVRRSTSAWPRTPSSWPASPTAWSRRPTRYLRMDGETPADPDQPSASRGQIMRLRGAAAGALDGHRALVAYDGTPLPVRRRRARHRPDHHPRHRPRRLPALPAEGDLRGAGVVPQDAAGQAASRPTASWRSGSATDALPDDVRAELRAAVDHAGSCVIGQGTAAVAGQSLAGGAGGRALGDAACGSSRCWPPSCPGSSCAPT